MPKITIHHARKADFSAVVSLYNHYIENTSITFDLQPFSEEEREGWFQHFKAKSPHQLWVARDGEDLLGYASSSQFKPKAAYATSVEVSVYLHANAAGKGLGSRLYQALFSALDTQPLHRAYAAITQPNAASNALHEKLGFSLLGVQSEAGYKFDRYWDVMWYEKKLDG